MIRAICLSLLVLCLTSLAGPGRTAAQPVAPPAPSPQAWASLCTTMGKTAARLATLRDQGVPPSQVLQPLDQTSDDVAARMRILILLIYEQRWWTPAYAQQQTELECFKRQPRATPGGAP